MDISYRQGIRSKGFAITCPTGVTQQTLSLSGLAKSFEGILLTSAFTATPGTVINPKQLRVTLTINNDVAIEDDVALHYASPATGGFSGGFLSLSRSLAGLQDRTLSRFGSPTLRHRRMLMLPYGIATSCNYY